MNVMPSLAEMPKTEADELWYKDAVIYQLHVKAFADSTNDGIGDFPGLTEKLDYLQELGVTCLWLLPFYPSPGRDDGYDIADYGAINPDFGTMKEFRRFITEAKRRGLRVITELVINHTSDQHVWFKRARRSPPGSSACLISLINAISSGLRVCPRKQVREQPIPCSAATEPPTRRERPGFERGEERIRQAVDGSASVVMPLRPRPPRWPALRGAPRHNRRRCRPQCWHPRRDSYGRQPAR